eukprot:6345963-Amphidinium_carterae.1
MKGCLACDCFVSPPRNGDDQWCTAHSLSDSGATGEIPMMGEGVRADDNLTNDEVHATFS